MKKTLALKLMIIENFIDHIESNEVQRNKLKVLAKDYVQEDHVDEIEQGIIPNVEDEMGKFLANEIKDLPKVHVALKKALKKGLHNELIDNLIIDKEGNSIDPIQRLEFAYSVKSFCDLVGIEE